MSSNKRFQFELSPSELRWLVEVLGYVQFPLFGIPKKNETEMELVEELEIGKAKIQERGFARLLSRSGWQVERLIIAITQLIANPDSVQILQIWHKDGDPRRALIYPNLDLPLFVEVTDVLKFTVHSDHNELNIHKRDFFNLSSRLAVGRTSFQITLPRQSRSLSWNSFEDLPISSMMNSLGTSVWNSLLTRVTTMGLITHFWSSEDGFDIREQKCLFWNKVNVWGGPIIDSGTSGFEPCSHAQVIRLLEI